MTTSTKDKTVDKTKDIILQFNDAGNLLCSMIGVMLEIKTMDADALMIYKAQVQALKNKLTDNAEVRFLESVVGLISASTKDAMFSMETLLNDDDNTTLEQDPIITTAPTKVVELGSPPKKGLTVKNNYHNGTKLWLTTDIMDTMTVGDKELPIITSTEGQHPIIEMDIWGWANEFPAAYDTQYQLLRPLSVASAKLWKGEKKSVHNVLCGVIKLRMEKRNPAQKAKADADLVKAKK